jgi:hypothetical protein
MTTHPQALPLSEKVSCEVCKKEVPRSAAVNFEVKDYVAHFCGLECYAQWKGREAATGTAEDGDAQP